MRTFQPKFNITNRMIAAITRTELARCTHIISGGLLAFALSSLASESDHLETLDSVQVVKIIREPLRK
jgi:hypothetical protein